MSAAGGDDARAGGGTGPSGKPGAGGAGASRRRWSRRGLLAAGGTAGAAAVVGGALAGCGDGGSGGAAGPTGGGGVGRVALPPAVAGLPPEQHRWDGHLTVDASGNAVPPRHQRLLLLELVGHPTVGGGDHIERALRLVEQRAHDRGLALLSALGWSNAWFRAIAQPSPIEAAKPLSETEAPTLDSAVACLHLGCDDATFLDEADRTFVSGVRGVLTVSERRTGFVGEGLPRAATSQLEDHGRVDVPAASPLFMGFKSGMRKNQATEQGVTIDHGRWRGGTTMHVSRIALTLPSWYGTLSDAQRTLRMHGPGVTAREAQSPGDGLEPPSQDIATTARKYGVVGHTQAAAVVRKRGRPLIIRRDFNGVEDGQPFVYFVSLQRSIDDFVATRTAVNADNAVAANPEVGAQVNNGINEWLSVHNRANFLVPPRAARAFPGLRPAEVGA